MGKSLAKNEGQEDNNNAVVVKERARALTAAEFHRLAVVPPAIEWFGNIRNEKTRRGYKSDVQDFMRFVGIQNPEEFRDRHPRACDRLARHAPCEEAGGRKHSACPLRPLVLVYVPLQ